MSGHGLRSLGTSKAVLLSISDHVIAKQTERKVHSVEMQIGADSKGKVPLDDITRFHLRAH